jgi:outer membrane protein assembly factor BamB
VLWQQRRDLGAQNQLVTAGAIDPQGNVAVTCLTPGTTGTDAWTLKLAASNGNPLWNRLAPSGGGSNFPTAVTFGPSGNVFLTGYTFTGTGAAHFLARLNGGNGTLAWSVTSGGAATSFALDPALAVCPNGRLVQVGTTSSPSQLHNVVVRSFTSGL